jgi:magnesium and cobalt transporter
MIFNTLGRVPARGEVVNAVPGFEFHVLDADPRRVKRLRIGLRKERPAVRPRDGRRREAAPDAPSQPQGDPASPPSPGDEGETP